jgi:hypothetical protein
MFTFEHSHKLKLKCITLDLVAEAAVAKEVIIQKII